MKLFRGQFGRTVHSMLFPQQMCRSLFSEKKVLMVTRTFNVSEKASSIIVGFVLLTTE